MDKFERSKFLIILISPSGGGKSSIAKLILKRNKDIAYSISYTTRKPRGEEKHGHDYFFVSEAKFKDLIKKEEFLEYALVHGNWYGTSISHINKKLAQEKHIVLDLDVYGAKQIMSNEIDSITIFILPPTKKELRKRLIKRGTDSEAVIKKRLKNSEKEIKEIENFQYLIINNNLEKAVKKVEEIIRAEENKVKRYNNIKKVYLEENC